MSRKIDMSNPDAWSPEDIAYLQARGRLPEGFEAPEADEEEAGYEGMSKKELRGLVQERGLDVDEDAKKAELIAALEEDDTSR